MSEQKLKSDIDTIAAVIDTLDVGEASKIRAVILYGSYGRGEGAFYEENGKTYAYNDYDLLLVVSKHLESSTFDHLKGELKRKLSIKWVDLSQATVRNLQAFPPTIYSYDLKYGSTMIRGDENVLENIPVSFPEEITLKDVEILYFTRLYTFMGSLPRTGFTRKLEGEDARFFRYQMAKAVFAVIDSLLVVSGQYHPSYRERLRRISGKNAELDELGAWAMEQKLHPGGAGIEPEEIENLYVSTLKLFMETMFDGLSRLYQTSVKSTDDIKKAVMSMNGGIRMKLKGMIKRNSYQRHFRMLKLNLAQSYLAEAFFQDGKLREASLEKASELLEQVVPGSNLNADDWHGLRMKTAELRTDQP